MISILKLANLLAVKRVEADIDALVTLGIAYSLPLPPANEVKFAYYRDNLKSEVETLVCDINEMRVVNCEKVIEQVRTSYLYRNDAMNFPKTELDPVMLSLSEEAMAALPSVLELFQL